MGRKFDEFKKSTISKLRSISDYAESLRGDDTNNMVLKDIIAEFVTIRSAYYDSVSNARISRSSPKSKRFADSIGAIRNDREYIMSEGHTSDTVYNDLYCDTINKIINDIIKHIEGYKSGNTLFDTPPRLLQTISNTTNNIITNHCYKEEAIEAIREGIDKRPEINDFPTDVSDQIYKFIGNDNGASEISGRFKKSDNYNVSNLIIQFNGQNVSACSLDNNVGDNSSDKSGSFDMSPDF